MVILFKELDKQTLQRISEMPLMYIINMIVIQYYKLNRAPPLIVAIMKLFFYCI